MLQALYFKCVCLLVGISLFAGNYYISIIQVCSTAISMVSLLLCSYAGDLEESKTTVHSSATGD